MFDEVPKAPGAQAMPPRPPSTPPRPPQPVAPAASPSAVEDMFESVSTPGARPPVSSMPPRGAGSPAVPPVASSPAAMQMTAPSHGGGAVAVKVTLGFVVVVGLVGGTVYYLNARSKAAQKQLPPVAPTEEMLKTDESKPSQETQQPVSSQMPASMTEPVQEMVVEPSGSLPMRDTDNDGLSDDQERTFGTDPTSNDSDGDALFDYDEVINFGTNPLARDTDADGLTDAEEVKTYLTDPKKLDTDGDGYSDKQELDNGYDPKGPGKLAPKSEPVTEPASATPVTPVP